MQNWRILAVGGLMLACVCGVSAADDTTTVKPPVAKKVPKTTEINGTTLVDNYYWMREKSNPRTQTR
jgi:oligopeptidase B